MGMFDAPNRRPLITENYAYFKAQISSNLTAVDVEELTAQIQNSIDISYDEEDALLALIDEVTAKVTTPTQSDKVITSYQKEFAAWYMSNIVVISMVQWLFVFFLVLKLKK